MSHAVDRDLRGRGCHVAGDPVDERRVGVGREHPSHEPVDLGAEVALEEAGDERILRVLAVGLVEVQVAVDVDPDEPAHASAELQRRIDDDVPAHRVPDEDDVVRADLADDGRDVTAERRHGPRLAARSRLAVPGQVDRDDAVSRREARHLVDPVGPIARPAMDEDEARVAGSVDVEHDRDAIRRRGRVPHGRLAQLRRRTGRDRAAVRMSPIALRSGYGPLIRSPRSTIRS